MKKGFTLVELVIVIVVVGVLSIVAVPIYRGYVEKAKQTEGKALASAIRTAQMIYYAEHGGYYTTSGDVDYDPVLMVDARGNKYFTKFRTLISSLYAGAWAGTALDSINAGDRIDLYWSTDISSPAMIGGYKAPVFVQFIDGKSTYTNS